MAIWQLSRTILKEDPDLVFSKDSNGWTPLHFAAFNGHKDVVELLLASRADVNAKDNEGYTPLHWAAERGREDVVEFLRQHGGNDFSGDIHRAARVGDLRAVRALLAVNPDLVFNKVDHGMTPLHDAAYGGRKEVADFLLANKAEVDAKDIIVQTPLHWAVEHSDGRPSYKATAESLLANKAEVNARDALGRTPLHYAALHGDKGLAELPLANRADVNAKDNGGFTPTGVEIG